MKEVARRGQDEIFFTFCDTTTHIFTYQRQFEQDPQEMLKPVFYLQSLNIGSVSCTKTLITVTTTPNFLYIHVRLAFIHLTPV